METETAVKMETKVKNQSKVNAGRRSAALRKAREEEREQQHIDLEERLARLEEHKLRIFNDESLEKPSGDEVPVQSVTASGTTEKKFDLTPWVIGGVGLAAVVYGLYRQVSVAKPKRRDAAPPSGVSPGMSVAALQSQLYRRDPFYME